MNQWVYCCYLKITDNLLFSYIHKKPLSFPETINHLCIFGGHGGASWISWALPSSHEATISLTQCSSDNIPEESSHKTQLGYFVSFSSPRIYSVPSWASTLCLQHLHNAKLSPLCLLPADSACDRSVPYCITQHGGEPKVTSLLVGLPFGNGFLSWKYARCSFPKETDALQFRNMRQRRGDYTSSLRNS